MTLHLDALNFNIRFCDQLAKLSKFFCNDSLSDNCVRHAGGTPLAAASSCVTDLFRGVFLELKTLAVRCVELPYAIDLC